MVFGFCLAPKGRLKRKQMTKRAVSGVRLGESTNRAYTMTMRILVVEDEGAVRENIVDLLQSDSVEVVSVSNGLEGFQRLKQSQFDLIIMDYHMPKMTGLDLLRICREESIRVPTICLTGKDHPELRKYAWEFGLFDYIEKSANTEDLIESVQTFVQMKQEIRSQHLTDYSSDLFRVPFSVVAPVIHKTTYRGFLEWCDSQSKTPSEVIKTLLTDR
jgi:CheY-like chemotaxis protein